MVALQAMAHILWYGSSCPTHGPWSLLGSAWELQRKKNVDVYVFASSMFAPQRDFW